METIKKLIMKTIKTRYLIAIILVVIGALFFTGYTLGHKNGDRASNALKTTLNDTINHYSVILNGEQEFISQKEQEITTLKEARKQGDITNAELRKLHIKDVSEISRIKLRVDTLLHDISSNGQVIQILDSQIANYNNAKDTTGKRNAIILPFSFEKKDKWLSLEGNFNSTGVLNVKYILQFGVDLLSGIDKATKKRTVSLVTDSPYIQTIKINSMKFDEVNPKRYGIGIITGYGANLNGTIKTYPFIGIGFSYIIIRF